MPKRDRLLMSNTRLAMLARCGEQYRRRYIEGHKVPPDVGLIVGRAVDSAVSENLEHKMGTGELLEAEAVQEAARDALHAGWSGEEIKLSDEEIELGPSKVRGQAVDKTVRLASLHHNRIAPQLEPTSVQRRWEVDMADAGYPTTLVGIIDVEEDRILRDTKTSKKSPAKDQADKSEQLTLYALGVMVNDGTIPEKLTLDYLVDKANPEAKVLETTRTEEDFPPVLARIERALGVIEAGAFAPANPETDWWCSPRWCGYWSTCPFVRRGATVSLSKEKP